MADEFGYGQQDPSSASDDFNATTFLVRQLVAQLSTTKWVKVMAVTVGAGSPPAAGTVDVQPLVMMVDGNRNATAHGTIYGIPWLRIGAGPNAVIMDPVVGDIGVMVCADRDSSKVKQTKDVAPPGSRRMYDASDGVYIGAILAAAPEQWVRFTADGIEIVDKNGNSVTTGPDGMTLTDKNANQLQMRAGFVNVVTTSFQVNGVPVTVP